MQLSVFSRGAGLVLVWCVAVLLALGSQTFDEDTSPPLPPVTVSFNVTNSGDLEFVDDFTDDTVVSVSIGGTFEKAANDRITLREVPVFLDTGTSWTANLLPFDSEELLQGDFSASVTDILEFGIDRQPAQGQMESLFEGTTTLVTFSSTGSAVTLQTGEDTPQTLSFDGFHDAFRDVDQLLDTRIASKAYRTLENLWLLARISETLHREIEQEAGMLESVGLQEPLTLSCDNPSGMPVPSYILRWANDISDIGSAGNGDNFTASYTNCLINADGRYHGGEMSMNDYQLSEDLFPRAMSGTIKARLFFFATQELPSGAIPGEDQERFNGDLSFSAREQ